MKLIKQLRKQIEKDWGNRCSDFAIDCVVCQMHLALAILEQRYDLAIDVELWKKTRKHPARQPLK